MSEENMDFPKHLLTLADVPKQEVVDLIALACLYKEQTWKDKKLSYRRPEIRNSASEIENKYRAGEFEKPLKGRFVTMVFTKASTRTRLAFERAVADLGGCCAFLGPGDSQLSRGESIDDTLKVVERSSDIIVVRSHDHAALESACKWISVPVINALSDLYHPTESLADLMTMMETVPDDLSKHKAAYLGDANNVARSFALACYHLDVPCTIATPDGKNFPKLPEFLSNGGGKSCVVFSDDPKQAASGAKFIYTDTWHSMGEELSARDEKFLPFQVNENLVKGACEDYVFLHCLPAYRGKEVVASIIDGKHSHVFDQAENRTHTIKALLALFAKR